jgi:hypothetical protein
MDWTRKAEAQDASAFGLHLRAEVGGNLLDVVHLSGVLDDAYFNLDNCRCPHGDAVLRRIGWRERGLRGTMGRRPVARPRRRTATMTRLRRLPCWLLLLSSLFVAGEEMQRAEAAVLLPYGTNVARVAEVEVNYFPDRPLLQVAITTDARYVKRAEYRRDSAIQTVVDLLRFKERGRLYVVFEDNAIISFFVQN